MIGHGVLETDFHVHSVYSDGASTLEQNVAAATRIGLRRLCLADHVRASSGWVPEFTAAARGLRDDSDLELLIGVESKILDLAGHLDLPGTIDGVDLVLIADHQFPGELGPVPPAEVRALLERGALLEQDAIAMLVTATAKALGRVTGQRPLLAHLFSLLEKLGLNESSVPLISLELLANRALETGALVEINERRACPSARTIAVFAAAGVPVVAGSGSHHESDVGRYATVRRTLDAVATGHPA